MYTEAEYPGGGCIFFLEGGRAPKLSGVQGASMSALESASLDDIRMM